jgi:hypothetical protein
MRRPDPGRSRLILSLALLASWGDPGAALAGQAAGAPLPPIAPKELAARIREARDCYDDLGLFEVMFDEVRDTNPRQGDAETPILVIFHGTARYASNGVQWRAEYDGKIPSSGSTRLTPDHWITGFDGSKLYDWKVSHRRAILYETHHNPRYWSPRNLIWERTDELIDLLENRGGNPFPLAVKSEVVDSRPCYIVEEGKPGGEFQGRYVISPGQGYLPVRKNQQGKGSFYLTHDLHDLREVAPGLWAPGRIELDWENLRKDGVARPVIRRSIRVVEHRPRAVVNPAALAFDLPLDAGVTDPRRGISYFNDPWWPEIGAFLRERFDWPRTDLSPLDELRLASDQSLDGRPSPPLRIAGWLRGEPPQPDALKGKVVGLGTDHPSSAVPGASGRVWNSPPTPSGSTSLRPGYREAVGGVAGFVPASGREKGDSAPAPMAGMAGGGMRETSVFGRSRAVVIRGPSPATSPVTSAGIPC